MKNYAATGEDLLKTIPSDKQIDTYGNKIEPFFNYIVTVLIENPTEEDRAKGPNLLIRTEEQYGKDVAIMKTMVYTVEGFERFIEILEETNYLTVEGKEVKVNEILENLIEREDFENASKLTKEWNEYKLLNNV
jgi:hypothetical protein